MKPHTLQQNLLWPFFFLGRGVNVWALSKREFNISWFSVECFFRCRNSFFFSITFSSYNIMFWGFACFFLFVWFFFFLQFFHLLALSHPSIHLFSSTYSIQARKGLEPIPAATVWGCQSVTEFEFIFDNVLFFLAFLSPFLFLAFFVSLSDTHLHSKFTSKEVIGPRSVRNTS